MILLLLCYRTKTIVLTIEETMNVLDYHIPSLYGTEKLEVAAKSKQQPLHLIDAGGHKHCTLL